MNDRGAGERETNGGGARKRERNGGGAGERETNGGGAGERETNCGGAWERETNGGVLENGRRTAEVLGDCLILTNDDPVAGTVVLPNLIPTQYSCVEHCGIINQRFAS